ncbi:TIM barrel protein [uncultured Sphaerochaeta sp.]|uniref:sugar phosphate isomerase/epimerase family protein n=1 Tax=uncultured Sphaerochaeta sp. TaxID=886478 RepID=UPI002A0A1435|nr:TIM barrel protein [uncultured Sphaerochaeta sp.]
MKRSQIALGNYPYPLYPFTQFLDDTISLGIENIEVWAASPHLGLDDMGIEEVSKLKHEIISRGLRVICVTPEQCAYPINIGSEDETIRKRSLRYLLWALESASLLESPLFLVTPGNGYRSVDPAVTFFRTVESLHLLDSFAQKLGVSLVLEHLTNTTTNVAILAEELFNLYDSVASTNMHCMVDTDMAWRYGQTAEAYIKEAKKRNTMLAHVHLVDGMPGGHLVPGDGLVPLSTSLYALQSARYEGAMTFEITNERYYDNPKMALQRCLDWIDPFITD